MKTIKWLTIASVLGLAACQTTPGKSGTEQVDSKVEAVLSTADALKMRSQERWELIVAGKFEEAYEFLSPGYRQTKAVADYAESMANRPIRWTEGLYDDHSCSNEDVCTVKVLIKFDLDMPVANVGRVNSLDILEEKWIRVDNQWYFLPTGSNR